MGLQSDHFKGDVALEACLVQDSAHVTEGAIGIHVSKIQSALAFLDKVTIDAGELHQKRYGPSTAAAVLAYKQKRGIINSSYQNQADNIVGKMTIARLDKEMIGKGGTTPPVPDVIVDTRPETIRRARLASQAACLRAAQAFENLLNDVVRAERMVGAEKVAMMAVLLRTHGRTIFVAKEFLKVDDPFSAGAQNTYRKASQLFNTNRNTAIDIVGEGPTGKRCFKPAFAWTARLDAEPRMSCCDAFFNAAEDCRRDVITHEVFHAIGLIHVWETRPIRTSEDAMQDCNSMAQAAAFIVDPGRNKQSCAHHLVHNLPV